MTEAPHVHIVEINGRPVHCYGEVLQAQKYEFDCMNPNEDGVAEPNLGKYFDLWEEVAEALQYICESRIVEIRAIL